MSTPINRLPYAHFADGTGRKEFEVAASTASGIVCGFKVHAANRAAAARRVELAGGRVLAVTPA